MDTLLGIGLLVATLVLAIATIGLWRSTSSMAKFAGESVRLTRENIRVAETASAPRLTLRTGGRGMFENKWMDGIMRIDNVGGGLAQDVEVETSWGRGHLETPVLRPGEHALARVRITLQEWGERRHTEDENPLPQRVHFLDSGGRAHEVTAVPSGAATWVATIPPEGA